ncbi:hypothetical protein MK852_13045 [Shewanella benthica]|nr:hypothetical protein [Shewanella benthica]
MLQSMKTNFSLNKRPDPHPLDNDWRFTSETVERIVGLLADKDNILLVGTPSLAYELMNKGKEFTLVDRQLVANVPFQFNVDVGVSKPIEGFYDAVVIDAPWYEEETLRWISWASQSLAPEGTIFSTLWPENTRPTAGDERKKIFEWLRLWSSFDIKKNYLSYEQPYYEKVAEKYNPDFCDEKKWIYGDILILNPFRTLKLLPNIKRQYSWQRYVIGNMQLAVREDSLDIVPNVANVDGSDGWIWPHISKRAPGRKQIGFWSSENKVATLSGSIKFVSILDAYLGLEKLPQDISSYGDIESFEELFSSWSIPRNCADRVKKWKSQN